MDNHAAQKRPRAPSGTGTGNEAGRGPKRVQGPCAQPASTVGHATAAGSARMLNGNVHGDNIHGNVNTTINFLAGACKLFEPTVGLENSRILSTSERKELMECLRFPQLDARLSHLRKAASDTCEWITQRRDYKKWLESDEMEACDGLFWIKGNPGTGKSIAMKFLYQRLQWQLRNATKNKLVISFFFNARGNKFEKSTIGLYRSLLFNLFNLEPNLQEALDHCQRSGYYNILESGWQLQMLKEIFEEAMTLLQDQGKRLYCYVDALDECPEEDVQDMVSYFEDLVGNTDSQHFRVCFSSRHYPQLSIRTKLTITLDKEQYHNEDIRTFIESQLRFEEDVDAALLQQIRAEILEKSSGIFLWVILVVHQLNEVQRQDGRMTAVQQRLQEIPEAVKNRPGPNGAMSLYGLFQDIIQKDEKDIDKLVRITQLILHARRPLHPKQLYVLLHQAYDIPFDPDEASERVLTKHVLEVSKGLAEVTKSEEPTIQFIHETVREFLRDGGLKNISTQSVGHDGNEMMKASCLNQIRAPVSQDLELLADYRRRGCYRKANQVTTPEARKFSQQANTKFPFLEYAAKNLLFHAEEAGATGVSQREFLADFPMAEWVSIYNLFEDLETGRYSGITTPMLYILADHGYNHLIKTLAEVREQHMRGPIRGHYLREVKGNVFSSALACAIYNGHFDTAWTLADLDPKTRPQDIVVPLERDYESSQSSLIRMLLKLGDVPLMRKVLEDRQTMKDPVAIDFRLRNFTSAEMIDLFLEMSVVPGLLPVGNCQKGPQGDSEAPELSRSNANLKFIRGAIEERRSLLGSTAWDGMTMLDYAMRQCMQSLVSLHLEYSNGRQSDLDDVLHRAAARGSLSMVTFSHRLGANLASRNEEGRTALHLAAADREDRRDYAEILQYLLEKEPSNVNSRDPEGRTALAFAADVLWQISLRTFSECLEDFLQSGADPNTLVRCGDCENHDLPLMTFLALRGTVAEFGTVAYHDRCNLNGRDNFGRTALSWCFAYQHGKKHFGQSADCDHKNIDGAIGEELLQQPAVDVNSRDDFGYTILEHFIRHPSPFRYSLNTISRSVVCKFFQSNLLDPNLRTSNGLSPMELVVSLYDTWPVEFGDIQAWLVTPRKKDFNLHLIEALELLLATGKVDIDVQWRCAGQGGPELQSVILGSIESMP